MSSRICAWLILVVLAVVAGNAQAQDNREATAKALFDEAGRHYDSGEFDLALEKYRAAYRVTPRTKILLNIGAVLFELGRYAEAANTFDEYLHSPGADPVRTPKVQETLSEIDQRVGRVQFDVTVNAAANEPSATIWIDGQKLGPLPFTRTHRVPPGSHRAELRAADGRVLASQSFDIAAGLERRVQLVVESKPPPPPPPPPSTSAAETRARLGIFARTDIDLAGRGFIVAPGASVHITSGVEAFSGVLFNAKRVGFEVGARWRLGQGLVRPMAIASVPVFYSHGARPSGKLAVGAAVPWSKRLQGTIEFGVSYTPSVPFGHANAVVIGALGVEMSL